MRPEADDISMTEISGAGWNGDVHARIMGTHPDWIYLDVCIRAETPEALAAGLGVAKLLLVSGRTWIPHGDGFIVTDSYNDFETGRLTFKGVIWAYVNINPNEGTVPSDVPPGLD